MTEENIAQHLNNAEITAQKKIKKQAEDNLRKRQQFPLPLRSL